MLDPTGVKHYAKVKNSKGTTESTSTAKGGGNTGKADVKQKKENAVSCVALHIHQISVLDDFGAVIQGMISHLFELLTVEGNDFLHFNLHRLIVMSLVIEQSIECDFLPVFRHGHRLSFF